MCVGTYPVCEDDRATQRQRGHNAKSFSDCSHVSHVCVSVVDKETLRGQLLQSMPSDIMVSPIVVSSIPDLHSTHDHFAKSSSFLFLQSLNS